MKERERKERGREKEREGERKGERRREREREREREIDACQLYLNLSLPIPPSTFLPRIIRREIGSLSDKCIKLREKEIDRERKRERERDACQFYMYLSLPIPPSTFLPCTIRKEIIIKDRP